MTESLLTVSLSIPCEAPVAPACGVNLTYETRPAGTLSETWFSTIDVETANWQNWPAYPLSHVHTEVPKVPRLEHTWPADTCSSHALDSECETENATVSRDGTAPAAHP